MKLEKAVLADGKRRYVMMKYLFQRFLRLILGLCLLD